MYQQHSLEVFQRYFSLASWRLNYKEETHVSVRKLIRKDIFAYVEVIKAFMKTKKKMGKHIQDGERLAEELQKYPCLYKKGNK